MASATPVKFTTNAIVGTPGPYKLQYITVYVDNVKQCYTDSNGDCTGADLGVTPGLHRVDYVWATCTDPDTPCPRYGQVTRYINVPDQTTP